MLQIVLLEDDIVFAQVLMQSLAKQGFATHWEARAQAVLELSWTPIDCFLIDLHLTDESGLTVIAPLRARYPQAKIIVLTGFASIATAVQAIKLGADEYLSKPAPLRSIVEAIQNQEQTVHFTEAVLPSPKRLQWEYVQKVLQENDGNISKTARVLKMHRRTLQRQLQKKPPK
jgi:two-component system response regulator RegA